MTVRHNTPRLKANLLKKQHAFEQPYVLPVEPKVVTLTDIEMSYWERELAIKRSPVPLAHVISSHFADRTVVRRLRVIHLLEVFLSETSSEIGVCCDPTHRSVGSIDADLLQQVDVVTVQHTSRG